MHSNCLTISPPEITCSAGVGMSRMVDRCGCNAPTLRSFHLLRSQHRSRSRHYPRTFSNLLGLEKALRCLKPIAKPGVRQMTIALRWRSAVVITAFRHATVLATISTPWTLAARHRIKTPIIKSCIPMGSCTASSKQHKALLSLSIW